MTNIEVQARERFGIEGLGETYRQRVTKLNEKMKLNWGGVWEGLGDHESLGSWLGLVTYEDGREGQELTEKMAGLAGKIEKGENLKASELLEMMAFSEAKLRKLETMGSGEISGVSVSAFEVYPALADEAREMLRELREEKEKVMSRQGSLPGGGWKYRLGAGMAVGGVLLAACTGAAGGGVTPSPVEGGGGSSKPVVGEVTETLVAPTETMEPTVEATEVVEEMKVFVEDKLEYGGHQMDFRITMDKNDKIIQEAFDYFGFDDININEKKENARELIAKTLAYSLKDTYNYQNGANITLEEYVANPEKYPAKIMMRNEEGKVVEQEITYDQIKELEFRYTSGLDGELYYSYPGTDNRSFGYSFEGGVFTYYLPLSKRDPILVSHKVKNQIDLYGVSAVQDMYVAGCLVIPYSVEKIGEGKTSQEFLDNAVKIFKEYLKFLGNVPPNNLSDDEFLNYLSSTALFVVTLK